MESAEDTNKAPSILLVEDDKLARNVLGAMISRRFPQSPVLLAENGEVGLEMFKEHTPKLVLTDIEMPVMDGIRMASEIKALNKDTTFIVITAFGNKEYLDSFSEIGYCDYLLKPVRFEKLFDAVGRCFAKAKSMP